MDVFQQTGAAMLLAQEGQRQIALAMASKVRGWLAAVKAWQTAMPGTLPPTEYQPR